MVFAYDRPDHLRRTLAALDRCSGIDRVDAFVFADAPANPGVRGRVEEVREVARGWRGGTARCTFREEHLGVARSIVDGVSQVLARYPAVIVVEDDIVAGRAFLDFALAALARYEDRPEVMSISGYTPRLVTAHATSQADIFFARRSSSWGWATWRNRWASMEWAPEHYAEWIAGTNRRVVRRCGDDLEAMARLQLAGLIDSWAYRWALAHVLQDRLAVYPLRSLVTNAGADGSGRHVRKTRRFAVELWEPEEIRFPEEIAPDPGAEEGFRRTFDRTIFSKAKWFAKQHLFL